MFRLRGNAALVIASLAAPIIVYALLWLPVVRRYYVANVHLSNAVVDEARRVPEDDVLRDLMHPVWVGPKSDVPRVAELLLAGRVEIASFPSTTIGMPFDPADLDRGLPPWRLFLAGLGIPGLLLDAYTATGDERFLAAARDVILGWARYERRAWFPRMHLWNDHAIADRLVVLTDFWRIFRRSPEYDPAVAREVLLFATRSAAALAKPEQFTFSTNHGVMQNISLLRYAIAFPTLPLGADYRALAIERLRDQLAFYISDEGVVLEHSPDYQRFGVERLGIALRYATLLGESIPEAWRVKYALAQEVHAQLRRPDDTLPMFGDTGAEPEERTLVTDLDSEGRAGPLRPAVDWPRPRPCSDYPASGYAVWWDGLAAWPESDRLSQTAIAWSWFPGHAHKHADEPSVAVWARGQTWWTNVGRWPYETRGRAEAESWSGSNAPRLVGEPTDSRRRTRLLRLSCAESLSVIDLERRGPGGYSVRRQVVRVPPGLWVVVDATTGDPSARTTTTWTTASDVVLRRGSAPGMYELETRRSPIRLASAFIGSPDLGVTEHIGSFEPFAGWVVGAHGPEAAPAIVVEHPAAAGWAAAVWSLGAANEAGWRLTGTPKMREWEGPERWTLQLSVDGAANEVRRDADRVAVRVAQGERRAVALESVPDQAESIAAVTTAYDRAKAKYATEPSRQWERSRVTQVLLALVLAQETTCLLVRSLFGRSDGGLRALALFGWILVGVAVTMLI